MNEMAIVAEMADIFTNKLGMTTDEMMVLETFLLDIVDLALSKGQSAFALETMDALLDLHILKRSQLTAGSVLAFWDLLFPEQGLTFAGRGQLGASPPCCLAKVWKTLSKKHNCRHPERGRSGYPDRLAARGISSASVRMESLPVLRKRQLQRISLTGVPWTTARSENYQDDSELLAA